MKQILITLFIVLSVLISPVYAQIDVPTEDAVEIGIADAGGYYTGTEVEAALQEIGAGTAIDHGLLQGLADDDHTQYILVAGTRAFTGNQSFGGFNITNVNDIAVDSISADGTDITLSNDTWLGDNIKLGFGNTAAAPDVLIDYDSGNFDLEIDLTGGVRVGMNIATENDANLFNVGVNIGGGNTQDNVGIGRVASGGAKLAVAASGNYTEAFSLVNTTNIGISSIANYASAFLQTTTLDNTGEVGLGIYRTQLLSNFFEGSGSGMDLNILLGQIHIKSISEATTFDTAVGVTMLLSLNSAQTNTITTYDGYLSEAGSVAGGGSIDGTSWAHFRAENFPDYGGTIDTTTGLWIDKQTRGTTNYGNVLDGDGLGADSVYGDGQDAKIYYDDTNLIIDPDYVGTGHVQIHGTYGLAIETISADTTLNATHSTILADASGGSITFTLPPLSGVIGRIYNTKKIDSSANSVTLDGDGSEQVEFALTAILTVQGESVSIQAKSSGWYIF